MKNLLRLVLFLLILLSSNCFASLIDIFNEDFCLYYIPEETIYSLRHFIPSNEPPHIKEVEIKPIKPTHKQDIIVKVKVIPDGNLSENKISDVFINYSINGESYINIEMEEAVEKDSWKAKIPAQPTGTKINFFITAYDDGGNMVTEVPITDVKWNIDEIKEFGIQIPEQREDPRRILQSLDIVDAGFAYDNKYLYFHFNLASEVAAGSVAAPYLNVYSVGIYHPELFKKGSVKTNYVLIYSPAAEFVRFPEVGLLDTDKKLAEIIEASPNFIVNKNNLWVRFKKDAIKEFEKSGLKIIFGTAVGISLEPIVLKPIDATKFVKLKFVSHDIIIE